jgi:hypothetical protein
VRHVAAQKPIAEKETQVKHDPETEETTQGNAGDGASQQNTGTDAPTE